MKNPSKIVLAGVALTVILASGCVDQQVKQHAQAAEFLTPAAKSRADHEAVAAHYDQAAVEASKEAELMKKHLAIYESETWLYGKQKDSFVSHCKTLIERYQDIAKENQAMARLHHGIAERL